MTERARANKEKRDKEWEVSQLARERTPFTIRLGIKKLSNAANELHSAMQAIENIRKTIETGPVANLCLIKWHRAEEDPIVGAADLLLWIPRSSREHILGGGEFVLGYASRKTKRSKTNYYANRSTEPIFPTWWAFLQPPPKDNNDERMRDGL